MSGFKNIENKKVINIYVRDENRFTLKRIDKWINTGNDKSVTELFWKAINEYLKKFKK